MCKGIVVYFPLNRNSYERFFPIRDTLSMVQKKAAWNGQGDRQSKVVEQFASGFVATSSATEAEKSAQRDWDRSKLLAVNADDPQSAIYEQISVRSNMSAEGGTTRRGLGPRTARRGRSSSSRCSSRTRFTRSRTTLN